MKQKILFAIIGFFTLGLMNSCVDYSDATQAVNVQIQVQKPQEFVNTASLAGLTVTLNLNGREATALTDAQGVATFTNITPDIYTVSTSWELTAAQYTQLTGDSISATGCTVNGTINAQLISTDALINLPTQVAVNRDIIIGKIYYAGSKDNNNKNYIAGRYIELFNQSDKTLDVAGLYIGLIETESNPAYTLDNLHTAFNDSVVLLKQAFQIPTDQQYNVAPGQSILITNSAIDHSGNGTFENNLLQADFEAKDAAGRTQNNPSIKALNLAYSAYPTISTLNLLTGGPCGIVLFRTNATISSFATTFSYGKTSGTEFLVLPKRYILDGVDVLKKKNTGVDLNSKRLYNDIDAGYTHIESVNGYTGEVIYRKTSRIVNGRKLLLDTNNSSKDFQSSTSIKIRQYDE